MKRSEVIEAGLEMADYGDNICFDLSEIYSDEYIYFVGIELFDRTLIKCDESEDAVAIYGSVRDRQNEAQFLNAHSDEIDIRHHCNDLDDRPSFDENTSMLYRTKCGLFEVRLSLNYQDQKHWDQIGVLPVREINTSEFDDHMKMHYSTIWDEALDDMVRRLSRS